MAAKNNGRSTASKTASKKTSNRRGGKRVAKSSKHPIYREVGAFVCLFVCVFIILGFFSVDAVFIRALSSFAKGLVGGGYYIMPFVLVMAFVILIAHNGRPVRMRIICTFALPIAIGALVQLIGGKANLEWSLGIFKDLYLGGIVGQTGGLVSGFFGFAFASIFSTIGAVFIFVIAFLIALLGSLNMTVLSLIQAIRNRPRLEYEEPEEPPVDTATAIVNHVATKRIERQEQRIKKRTADFDLPVDEPPMAPRQQIKVEQAAAKVVSPDQFLLEKMRRKTETETLETILQEPPLADLGEVVETPEAHITIASAPEPIPVSIPVPVPQVEPEPVPVQLPPLRLPPLERPAEPEKVRSEDAAKSAAEITRQIAESAHPTDEYIYPPVSLLRASGGSLIDGTEEMRENTERLNTTLQSFGIDAHIVNVTRGPSVTRYELELDRGVKLSKVTNLADDIALSLGATGVRISAIPDKISVVGIEVPNRLVSTVLAKDVIDSPEFSKSKSRISFAVGKDIGGNRIIGDIAKLPHMLIAGTTGSGKSVCMNSLIISLLFKAKPEEVRLIMVDPKMVELGVYNGIPHLLIPVVTDPKKAAGALQWAVTEMMRRYRMMADAGVRDLDSYNKLVKQTDDERTPMEQVVVVIDELADLMLVAAKEVEESICRIAQMGRASGIHLVIATQRPSADVITGLMKANIPSRIAFAVASAMESRIILDTQGAEKLVGKGDMLYAPLGQGKPKRVQGCFITDDEVQEVVNFIKNTSTPNYSDEVAAQIDQRAEQGSKGDGGGGASADMADTGDELLPAAVEVILETGQASVSMLQRRLKLGYARAARIVDEMEDKGIVGPFEGSKPRQLLITKDQWHQMQSGDLESENPPVEDELF